MSKKVHFILDEAAALGHMPALDDAVDKYRGYGVRLQLYYQSLGQLKKCWPKDEGQTLLSNTTKIFFGCNSLQEAEFLSKSLGPETILVEGGGHSTNWGTSHSTSTGQGSGSSSTSRGGGGSRDWRQQSRELLKPDEILQLDPRTAITLTPGVRPLWTRLIRYYEEKALFRHRGLLSRIIAACRTLLLSAALLVIAIAWAAFVTAEISKRSAQRQKQPLWHPYQPAPGLIPR
jgi:type IV secretion system protein VirD4